MRWIPRIEALLLLACACGERLADPIPAAHPDDASPRRGGTARMASFADIRAIDPPAIPDALSAGIAAHVFAGLVDFDREGHVIPDIAERWTLSPDGLVYTFTLRQGVRFHDGEELVADDVKRSIERALHKDTPSPFASFYDALSGFEAYTKGNAEHLGGARVLGRYVIELRLAHPDAMFLPAFALPTLRPVCRSAGDRYDEDWHPCGAGPFKLLPGGWEHGRSITLTRHDAYFKPGRPYLDAIVWSFGMAPLTQRYLLEGGELEGNRELALADALRLSTDARWKPFASYEPETQIGAINLNVEVPPFDNVEVRRAVACAIDRERVRLLRAPNLRPLGRIIPPYLSGDDPAFPSQRYDVAEALVHMRNAGYAYDPKTGQGGYPKTIPYLVYRRGLDEHMAQVFQQELAAIGLRVELRIVNASAFTALSRRRREVAISPQGWTQDFPDPGDFIEPIFGSAAINDDDTNNTAFYSNRALDELLARARREMDEGARRKMYRDADAMIVRDAPWVPVFAYRFFAVHQPYVRGYAPHPVWNEDLRAVWLDRAGKELEKHAGVFGPILGGR